MSVRLFPALAMALTAAVAAAQAPPLGAEFQVNTYTTDAQESPSVAVAPSGAFVVVWTSVGQDGSGEGVFGQRYDSLGHAAGSEFQVNSFTTGNQRYPSVGMDDSGKFVVVWASIGQASSSYAVFGQRYDGSGTKIGTEFPIDTSTTQSDSRPRVAVRGDGSFIVAWQRASSSSSLDDIEVQRFQANGAAVGTLFQANTYSLGLQLNPAIAADRDGDFVVAWQSQNQDGDAAGIFGQRFDAAGNKLGPEFQANTYTEGNQAFPAVATDAKGNFVVVWQDTPGSFGGKYGIFAQRFNGGSEKVGAEIPVAESFTTLDMNHPAVAMGAKGDFLVVWDGFSGGGTILPRGLFAQHFDRSGAPDRLNFQVNTGTGTEAEAAVAESGLSLVIASDSDTGSASGDPFGGVVARRADFAPVGLKVDAYPDSGSSSDVNGVLEPGEAAVVEPSWKILAGDAGPSPPPVALSGTASTFLGPLDGFHNIEDASADYGSTAPLASTNCHDATAGQDCYRMFVTSADHGGVTHWDATFDETLSTGGVKTWTLHVGSSFSDVPESEPFYKRIETLLHFGITSGCTPATYCPGEVVNRDQMAIFIAKGIAGLGELVPSAGTVGGQPYDCSPGGASLYSDVSPTDSFCKHVHYLGAQNVTLGCGTGLYCPGEAITRDAMASFIAKAIVAPGGGAVVPLTYGPDPMTGLSYSCAAGSPNLHFADVPASNPFCKHIHYLWAKGIISGCSATQYCLTQPVARDAMAKFIANGFGLQLYGP
jgi:hypothetical protein